MSLRKQFFISILLALFVSLSFLGVTASWHARLSVENEMRTALSAANHVIESMLGSAPGPDSAYLSRLVHSFDGNRHVTVKLTVDNKVLSASALAVPQKTPGWFSRLLQIPPSTKHVAISAQTSLDLSTDPQNEIGEAWGQFRDGAVILGLFGFLAVGLLHILIARTAAPLKKLAAGFDAVGGGNYATHVTPQGPREISHLASAFNRMAARLEKLETANRNLNMQMTTIQEEERADLARDLHDEMGPFLFAMRVDAETIDTQAKAQGLGAIAARARAIGEAVTHIQQHVRNILKQLRPAEIADVDISQAIANLATFWQRYHVGVNIHIDIAETDGGFGEQIDDAIYRLVQESLTNAVRHGGANDVSVVIAADKEYIRIHIQDNGAGLPDRTQTGMGLRGMQERITALGGSLTVDNRSDGRGASVAASIPRAKQNTFTMAGAAA